MVALRALQNSVADQEELIAQTEGFTQIIAEQLEQRKTDLESLKTSREQFQGDFDMMHSLMKEEEAVAEEIEALSGRVRHLEHMISLQGEELELRIEARDRVFRTSDPGSVH